MTRKGTNVDMFDLASTLFGRGKPVAQGSTLTATGSAASAGGTAYLTMDADVTPAEGVGEDTDQTVIDVPTSPSVAEGDEVIITLVGDGPLKTPVVMANPGSGDRMQAQVDSAETLASEAQQVAQATGQYFWHKSDDLGGENGAHVTQVPRETWEQSQTGPNSLWNSLGMLFRDGLNNILAIVSGTDPGIAIYDGSGNTSDHVLALLTKTLIRLGGRFASSGTSTATVQFFEDDSALTDLTAEHYIDTTVEPRVAHDFALSSTVTDDELPEGTSRTVTGNVEIWEQIYHDSTSYSDEVDVSLNASPNNRQYGVSLGATVTESSGNVFSRIAYAVADTLRLTYGTGAQASVNNFPMSDVVTELTNASGTGTFSSPFANYDNNAANAPHWYRSGNVVHFHGIARNTSQISSGVTSTLFTLPAGFRPKNGTRYMGRMQGSNLNSWLLAVNTAGNVNLARYGTTSEIAIPSGQWFPFSGTFIID